MISCMSFSAIVCIDFTLGRDVVITSRAQEILVTLYVTHYLGVTISNSLQIPVVLALGLDRISLIIKVDAKGPAVRWLYVLNT